ncbi:MAG: ABC transporter ATP-binding protein [Phycisphaerae bacterium]
MADAVVRFAGVSKRFRTGETHDSLYDVLGAIAARLIRRAPRRAARDTFWALKDVDFAAASGTAIGIIGPNGAGKSTALKILAGILRPDEGTVSIRGRLSALIEVGAGFHGDLTGRENIFLNGAIMGMTRRDVRAKLDDIVAFAGIERFLDTPVKRYSSGMYARLGFSIAAHIDPDVLLVDEVLSVGDAVFRLRCVDRMRSLIAAGTTLVFVTHNLDQMLSICDQTVVLERGRITFSGPPHDAVDHYMTAMARAYASRRTDIARVGEGAAGAVLTRCAFLDRNNRDVVRIGVTEPLRIALGFRLHRPVSRLVVELNMQSLDGRNLVSINSGRNGITFDAPAGDNDVVLSLPALPFAGGEYFWNVRMWDADAGTTELDTSRRFPIVIDDGGTATGMVALPHEWHGPATPATTARSVAAHKVPTLDNRSPDAPTISPSQTRVTR